MDASLDDDLDEFNLRDLLHSHRHTFCDHRIYEDTVYTDNYGLVFSLVDSNDWSGRATLTLGASDYRVELRRTAIIVRRTGLIYGFREYRALTAERLPEPEPYRWPSWWF